MAPSDDGEYVAYDSYRKLADSYAEKIDTNPHNAYLEKPATLSLFPDVNGFKVLDAGCGTGVYSDWLVEHGAEVVAVDASPHMLEHAEKRLGDRVELILYDLNKPLTFLEDSSLDMIVSSLVLHYIKDWIPVLTEFYRILRTGGILIFSIEHPFCDYYKEQLKNYFDVERIELWWTGFGEKVLVPSYRRPLSYISESLRESGFQMDRIIESIPTKEYKKADPESYEKVRKKPSFLHFRAIKT